MTWPDCALRLRAWVMRVRNKLPCQAHADLPADPAVSTSPAILHGPHKLGFPCSSPHTWVFFICCHAAASAHTGLDYEPVPGLHPELYYPDTKPAHTNTSTKAAAAAALKVTPAAAEPSQVSPAAAAAASAEDVDAAQRDQAAAAAAAVSKGTADHNCSLVPSSTADPAAIADAEHTDQGPTAAQAGSKDTPAPMDTTPAAEDTNPDTPADAAPAAAAPADSTPRSPSAPAAAHAAPAASAAAAKQTTAPTSPAGPAATAAGTASGGIDWSAALAAAEAAAAASAAYPYPLPCDRTHFDAASSEDELPYEADWVAGIIQGKNLSAAAVGSRPPYGSSTAANNVAFPATAVVGAGAGGSVDGGRQWDPADHRRQHRERMGSSTSDIPTINMNWTGDEKVSFHCQCCKPVMCLVCC